MDQIIADLNNASNKIKNEYMNRKQQLSELQISNKDCNKDIIKKLEQEIEDFKDLYKTIRDTIDTKIFLMNI
jgi:predicted metal-binding transcription factor (methanogenesis marker protein 9)